MTHAATSPRTAAPAPALARRFRPRDFGHRTQVRFITRTRRFWRAKVPGAPSARQESMIEALADLDWAAEVCRADGSPAALRELREHLRLRDRIASDFERSLAPAPAGTPATAADRLADVRAEFGIGP